MNNRTTYKALGLSSTFVLAFFLLISATANAQVRFNNNDNEPRTLLGSDYSFGGFIGVAGKATNFNSQEAFMIGGEAAVTFNRRLNLGVAGYGLASIVESDSFDIEGRQLYHEVGYGGILIEPILFGRSVLHVTIPVILGAGGITETAKPYIDPDNWADSEIGFPTQSDAFFVAEPGLSLELNVAKWMRIEAGASYRYTSPVDLDDGIDLDINGMSTHVSLRLGWF